MGILAYLRRLKDRNAADTQAGTEIKKQNAKSAPLQLSSTALCASAAAALQAEFSVPGSVKQNTAVPLELEVTV